MHIISIERQSARTKGRRPNLLTILYAAYYLVAASAIFLTARYIQGAELPAFTNLVLKSAIGLNTPAIRLLLPPPGSCSAETGVFFLAVVLLLPSVAAVICLCRLMRSQAGNMESYDGLDKNLRIF